MIFALFGDGIMIWNLEIWIFFGGFCLFAFILIISRYNFRAYLLDAEI